MSPQINFYGTPTDIHEMEGAIRGRGPIQIIRSRSSSKTPSAVTSFDHMEDGKYWLYYHVVRQEDLPLVVTKHVPLQGYWLVDEIRSPVVEFNRSFFDNKIIRRGRLYYLDGYYADDGAWRAKPEAFLSWARAVFSAVRKKLEKLGDGSEYIGRDAQRWVKECNGNLVER